MVYLCMANKLQLYHFSLKILIAFFKLQILMCLSSLLNQDKDDKLFKHTNQNDFYRQLWLWFSVQSDLLDLEKLTTPLNVEIVTDAYLYIVYNINSTHFFLFWQICFCENNTIYALFFLYMFSLLLTLLFALMPFLAVLYIHF